MSVWLIPGAAVAALAIGFVAGFATYRRSRRWCTVCGTTLQCPACAQGTNRRPIRPAS